MEIIFLQGTLIFFVEKTFICVSLLLFGEIFLLIGIVTLLQGNDFTTVVAVCICGLAAFNVVTSLQCATNVLSSSIIESNVFLAVSISASFFFPGVNTFFKVCAVVIPNTFAFGLISYLIPHRDHNILLPPDVHVYSW